MIGIYYMNTRVIPEWYSGGLSENGQDYCVVVTLSKLIVEAKWWSEHDAQQITHRRLCDLPSIVEDRRTRRRWGDLSTDERTCRLLSFECTRVEELVELNGRMEKLELRFSDWLVWECSSGVKMTILIWWRFCCHQSFVSFPLKERERSIVQKETESCTEILTQKPHSSQSVDENTRTWFLGHQNFLSLRIFLPRFGELSFRVLNGKEIGLLTIFCCKWLLWEIIGIAYYRVVRVLRRIDDIWTKIYHSGPISGHFIRVWKKRN